MRRLAMPVVGLSAALLALSLAGLGPGEGGVVTGIFGVAFGAVLHLAGGTASSRSLVPPKPPSLSTHSI